MSYDFMTITSDVSRRGGRGGPRDIYAFIARLAGSCIFNTQSVKDI